MLLRMIKLPAVLILCATAASASGQQQSEISSSEVCEVRAVVIPYSKLSVETSRRGQTLVWEERQNEEQSSITFQVPFDCEGRVVIPKTLQDVRRLLMTGLSENTSRDLAQYFGIFPGWERDEGLDLDEIRGLETFLFRTFLLDRGDVGPKVECTERVEFAPSELSVILLAAAADRLEMDDRDAFSEFDARLLVSLSRKVVDSCDM